MLFKLALKNVKKSYKDFAIYFLTLSLGVCIFYLFNSLGSQGIMLSLNNSQLETMKNLNDLMSILSIFVSLVLGFLIIYASNFLITRRKNELGIYLTLGMDRSHVSRVLVYETFTIGLVSLMIGLLAGFFLSHLLSIITANMFEMKIEEFKFVFSQQAATKTIIYFGLIFIIVIIFNVFVVSKLKLIKLINASKQNNEIKLKNNVLSIVLFIISLMILCAAYFLAIKTGIDSSTMIAIAFALGIIGTFLLFYSLSGFLLVALKKNKKLYYKELNSFIINQLNSRINTTFISTSIICLLIFLTIGILSTGASLTNTFNDNYSITAPFDASIIVFDYESDLGEDLQENTNITELFEKYHSYKIYRADELMNDILKSVDTPTSKNLDEIFHMNISILKLSDYNRLLEIQGLATIKLADDECYVLANMSELVSIWDEFLSLGSTIDISGNEFIPKNTAPIENDIQTGNGAYNLGTIVLNDKYVKEYTKHKSIVSGNYKTGDINDLENKLKYELEKFNKTLEDKYIFANTKEGYIQSSLMLKITLSYIGIYLGVVFLIACSTILSLIQLSEADDNIKRYSLLSKLGTSDKIINKSILISVLISFSIPLIIAIVHSIFGIWWASDTIRMLGKINILDSIIYTASIIVIVYGGYFLLTYNVVKRIIKGRS